MTNISHLFAIPEDISQPYRCTNQVYTYTINIHVHLASRQICLIWKVYESIHVSVQYKMKYNRVNYCICTDQTSLQSFTNKYLTYTSILPIQSILQDVIYDRATIGWATIGGQYMHRMKCNGVVNIIIFLTFSYKDTSNYRHYILSLINIISLI